MVRGRSSGIVGGSSGGQEPQASEQLSRGAGPWGQAGSFHTPLLHSDIARALVALFGMALAFSGTWPVPRISSGGAPRILALALPGASVALLLLAALVLTVALLFSVLPQPHRKDPDDFEREPPPSPRLSPGAIAVTFAVLLASLGAVMWVVFFLRPQQEVAPGAGPLVAATLHHQAAPSATRAVLHAPIAGWSVTVVLGLLAVGAIAFALWLISNNHWMLLRRPRRRQRVSGLAAALDAATGSAVEDLINDPDPRRAVIACYRRCERAVAEQRHPRYPWQTPREFIAAAMGALKLPAGAVGTLLGVFERARFGEVAMHGSDRDTALRAVATIRAALADRKAHDTG
ncbi:MAG: DUF4129 domain-containing protein [Acetobacteraceae bacterium]